MRTLKRTLLGMMLLISVAGCVRDEYRLLTEDKATNSEILDPYSRYSERSFKGDSIVPSDIDGRILREQRLYRK